MKEEERKENQQRKEKKTERNKGGKPKNKIIREKQNE